jgi:hypothetical protein
VGLRFRIYVFDCRILRVQGLEIRILDELKGVGLEF